MARQFCIQKSKRVSVVSAKQRWIDAKVPIAYDVEYLHVSVNTSITVKYSALSKGGNCEHQGTAMWTGKHAIGHSWRAIGRW